MKVEFDKKTDAAYIYMKNNIRKGEVDRTIRVNEDIHLDFDKKHRLLGIEILRATKNLPRIKSEMISAQ